MFDLQVQRKVLAVLLTAVAVITIAILIVIMLQNPRETEMVDNVEGKKNPEKYLKKISESVREKMK